MIQYIHKIKILNKHYKYLLKLKILGTIQGEELLMKNNERIDCWTAILKAIMNAREVTEQNGAAIAAISDIDDTVLKSIFNNLFEAMYTTEKHMTHMKVFG